MAIVGATRTRMPRQLPSDEEQFAVGNPKSVPMWASRAHSTGFRYGWPVIVYVPVEEHLNGGMGTAFHRHKGFRSVAELRLVLENTGRKELAERVIQSLRDEAGPKRGPLDEDPMPQCPLCTYVAADASDLAIHIQAEHTPQVQGQVPSSVMPDEAKAVEEDADMVAETPKRGRPRKAAENPAEEEPVNQWAL